MEPNISSSLIFFLNDTATTEIYTLSLHDALPICAVERNGEAFIAAPGGAHAEQSELVEEGVHRGLGDRLEHEAEQPAGAGKVAPPDGVARMALERRMEHARDLRPRFQPARDP